MTVGLIILIVFGDLLCGFLGFLFYKKLGREYIEIDYLYVFIGKNNLGAEAILKASNIDEVEAILLNNYY